MSRYARRADLGDARRTARAPTGRSAHAADQEEVLVMATDLPDAREPSDALTCWSAVLVLRVGHSGTPLDGELSRYLDELLGAVSLELELDPESVPKRVRCAAVELAALLVQRSSSRAAVPGGLVERPDSGRRTSRADEHARDIPFTPSIRLGRMG
jgi:hypothetical protein